MYQRLANQLVRDLKKSWQKTATLVVLLLVGLFFWVPPLVRAVSGLSSGSEPAPQAAAAPETPPPVEAEATFRESMPEEGNAEEPALTWETAEQFMLSHPLVRSADVAEIKTDPFRINHDQFSPPVLFARETESDGENEAQDQTVGPPEGLTLKSTILGNRLRAALINSKLYREGSRVLVDGTTYRLVAVHRRKVLLSHGDNVFEIEIAERSRSGKIDVTDD